MRIIQIAALFIFLLYLVLAFYRTTPSSITLPFLLPLPSAVAVFGGFILGFLLAWVPARVRRYRLTRENYRQQKRIEDLERTLGIPAKGAGAVIPDRDPEAAKRNK
ncbi:MAG: LapA family protein [Deinococcales bacterium]